MNVDNYGIDVAENPVGRCYNEEICSHFKWSQQNLETPETNNQTLGEEYEDKWSQAFDEDFSQ